jgi:hypothetical protein
MIKNEWSHLDQNKNEEWLKTATKHILDHADFFGGSQEELQVLYNAAEGIIDINTYSYVLNPWNSNNDKLRNFPAKLRNYPIIKPVINFFLGEHQQKNRKCTVVAKPANGDSAKKKSKMDFMAQYIAQDFVNNLNQMGMETGVPSVEIPGYDSLNKKFDLDYDDFRAKIGQEALDYIRYNVDFTDVEMQLFYDWLVIGRFVTYKDILNGDVYYEACDPRDIRVYGLTKSKMIEDAEGVIYERWISPTHLLTLLHDEIQASPDKKDIYEFLARYMNEAPDTAGNITYNNLNLDENFDHGKYIRIQDGNTSKGLIRLQHVAFKTLKEVATLTYEENGETLVREVSLDYKLDKAAGDKHLDKHLVNTVYENYVIDEQFYLGGGELPVQRHNMVKLAEVKLPYNGTHLGYRNSTIESITKIGLDFQVLTNIFMFRFEMSVAKAKDKLLAWPLGLIPDGPDWNEEKWMYHAFGTGVAFYDEQSDKAIAAIQGIKTLDMSLGDHLYRMWEFTTGIRDKYWEVIGMNRQRFGGSFASDGKGTNEQAILQSSIISADMSRQFDKGIEKDNQGLIDYAKIAFSKGKKGTYILSDASLAFLDLQGDDLLNFMETEYGIFAKNSNEELEAVKAAKQNAQALIQNGLPADSITAVMFSNSTAQIQEIVNEGVRKEREFQQQMEQQKSQMQQQAAQLAAQVQESKNQTDIAVAQIQAKAKVDAANIQANANLMDVYNQTIDEANEFEQLEQTTANNDKLQNDLRKQAFNERVHNDNVRLKEEDQLMKQKQLETQKQIAKMNKN